METIIIVSAFVVILFVSVLVTYFLTRRIANRQVQEYKSLAEAISQSEDQLREIQSEIDVAGNRFSEIDRQTKDLQALKNNADSLSEKVSADTEKAGRIQAEISRLTNNEEEIKQELHDVMSKLDLYSRLDVFVEHGHFEVPTYLFETSARFSEEIKRKREEQKMLIKDKRAVLYPEGTIISEDKNYNKKILDGQIRLMLLAFNIECDTLIGKVSPSSYARTLERIEKLANAMEKHAATMSCGFNIEYVELKYQECQLQYQHMLRKQEEQDEQRLIREQIREEQKAIKEYERAIALAENEERLYREMLEKAREELLKVSEEDRVAAEQRISELEGQLAEAEAKEARAKSMAEQTRKGHVYIISNIGSFGSNIYKIGLTRRLEPMDRVKELGDASVPFAFDVHAMIYVEDAPALESALHREFTDLRVNAVNLRKEFFRVELHSIRAAVERLAGIDAEFKMTALAEDYYESRRLQGADVSAA